jgi:hypothetical protein
LIDVTRTQPAPTSLARGKQYGGKDVKQRLREDFLAKCYLCEGNLPLGAMQVDHRLGRDPESLTWDWSNLFPACKCNQHRPKALTLPLLDPAGEERVEARLVQSLDGSREPRFAPRDESDDAARNTARELNAVHSKRHAHGADLRHAIAVQVIRVYADVVEYLQATAGKQTSRPLPQLREALRGDLSRQSPFTMLLRGVFESEFSLAEWQSLID